MKYYLVNRGLSSVTKRSNKLVYLMGVVLKPGLHIVLTIADYVSDVAPNRILRLSIRRLQMFLVKYEYLRPRHT